MESSLKVTFLCISMLQLARTSPVMLEHSETTNEKENNSNGLFGISRERSKELRLFTIQADILRQLGRRRPPTINTTVFSPQEKRTMINIYNLYKQKDEVTRSLYDGTRPIKKIHAYLPGCKKPRTADNSWYDKGQFRLFFDFDFLKTKRVDVESAYIELPIKYPVNVGSTSATTSEGDTHTSVTSGSATSNSVTSERVTSTSTNSPSSISPSLQGEILTVSLYSYLYPVRHTAHWRRGRTNSRKRFIARERIGHDAKSVIFDVKRIVKRWKNKPKKNHGLNIEVRSNLRNNINPNDIFQSFNCSDADTKIKYPTLHLNTTQRSLSYRKRRTAHASSCKWQPIYIRFKDWNWDHWIVEPKGFFTGYCKGTCATMMAKKSVNSKNSIHPFSSKDAQYKCCTPNKLKSLTVLHRDENGDHAVTVFDDFRVSGCGCRP
ncbi:unnamed protein product [Owenia fusiformis]|uniref:Uncharacterized protein n=1 Tax=Owenia fusiformis TaxID=6347 RepID=A0A8J1TT64_OWEFU|nr:unnamed protein product [Owenia fusiformis]